MLEAQGLFRTLLLHYPHKLNKLPKHVFVSYNYKNQHHLFLDAVLEDREEKKIGHKGL